MSKAQRPKRVLAVDPFSRGFGFVVLEGPDVLVDWGVVQVRRDKTAGTLRRVAELFDHYQPDVFVLEDTRVRGSRRHPRLVALIDDLVGLGATRRLKVCQIAQRAVQRAFGDPAVTKHTIATAIAERLPELARRLPPKRQPWMSEDERMGIFDAAALGIASFKSTIVEAPRGGFSERHES